MTRLLSRVPADPDGAGQGRLLSQTQTEAQTGASHQPDVREQLRGGGGGAHRLTDGPMDGWPWWGRGGVGLEDGGGG